MSVIGYERRDIVFMIAACWNYGSIGGSSAGVMIKDLADLGNQIMAANQAAYDCTYPQESATGLHHLTSMDPINPNMIKNAIVGATVESKQIGFRTLRGIRYNLIANNGKNFATAEILDGLLTMVTARLDMAERRASAA